MGVVIGIDLGTTFSVGSWVDEHGDVHVAPSRDGGNTTPSVVEFGGDNIIVGKAAKASAEAQSDSVVQFVKRQMGNGKFRYYAPDDSEYTAEEISALILKRVKADCEKAIGSPVTDAVITVPAYFDSAQRQATVNAGIIAGLNVIAIINEPTAAAFAYTRGKEDQAQTVMVYDIGGGTFDVTILRIIPGGEIQVLASDGVKRLGGIDFDNALIKYASAKILEDTGVNILEDDNAMQTLRAKCEQAKIALSSISETAITMTIQQKQVNVIVTKEKFEELTRRYVEMTEDPIDTVLSDSELSPSDLDKVLLVGGSSRIPAIRDFIFRKLHITPSAELNPDEVVSIGAAYYGAKKQNPSFVPAETNTSSPAVPVKPPIRDVLAHGLGIISWNDETGRFVNNVIVPRNTPLPVADGHVFSSMVDNQEIAALRVTEGDEDDVGYVRIIGQEEVALRPHPKGSPIAIEMSADENGIISVRALDLLDKVVLKQFRLNAKETMSPEKLQQSAERMNEQHVN